MCFCFWNLGFSKTHPLTPFTFYFLKGVEILFFSFLFFLLCHFFLSRLCLSSFPSVIFSVTLLSFLCSDYSFNKFCSVPRIKYCTRTDFVNKEDRLSPAVDLEVLCV